MLVVWGVIGDQMVEGIGKGAKEEEGGMGLTVNETDNRTEVLIAQGTQCGRQCITSRDCCTNTLGITCTE